MGECLSQPVFQLTQLNQPLAIGYIYKHRKDFFSTVSFKGDQNINVIINQEILSIMCLSSNFTNQQMMEVSVSLLFSISNVCNTYAFCI